MNIITDNLDQIIDAPDGIKRLRELILQLAVQGKLVEQRQEEGAAADLLKQLGVIPTLIDDPFEIPSSWEWGDLKSFAVFGPKNGYSPKAVEYPTATKSLTLSATTSGRFIGEHSKYIDETIDPDSHLWLEDGDILFQRGNSMEYVGVSAIYRGDSHQYIYPDLMMKVQFYKELSVTYLHTCFMSGFAREYLRNNASGTSGTMPKINQKTLNSIPIPLPPLLEQKRIVARVDELMAWSDELEALKEKRDALQRASLKATLRDLLVTPKLSEGGTAGESFQALENLSALVRDPADVKQLRDAILQLAVQGRLVEQRESDGTAADLLKQIEAAKATHLESRKAAGERIRKTKPLPTIGKEEIPFEIPKGWAWVRLGGIGLVGSSSRVHQKDWRDSGIPFYRAREIVKLSRNGFVENALFIDEDLYRVLTAKGNIPEAGDIMITGVGTIGVPYVVKQDDRFYFKDASVLIFKNLFQLNPLFLHCLFQSPHWNESIHEDSMGTTVHTFTISRANKIMIPLPPPAEQQRIVAKVEELMAWCDELETLLQAESAIATRFAAAIAQQGGNV